MWASLLGSDNCIFFTVILYIIYIIRLLIDVLITDDWIEGNSWHNS